MSVWTTPKNKWLTRALFLEHQLYQGGPDYAVFTDGDEDIIRNGRTYKSLKKLYMDSPDPTDYEFACDVLGGWDHWMELQSCVVLATKLAKWKEEKAVMLKSKGISRLIELADGGQSYQAAKYLADAGWMDKPTGKRAAAQRKAVNDLNRAQNKKSTADLKRIRDIRG